MIEIAGIYYETTALPVGCKIKFKEEKQRYTVRAANVAFAVCTRPFNLKKTVWYTIIDWHNNIRGAENLIFGFGATTDDDCLEMLERLTMGDSEVSSRNSIPLKIERLDGWSEAWSKQQKTRQFRRTKKIIREHKYE
jgi:IS1 family transposase